MKPKGTIPDTGNLCLMLDALMFVHPNVKFTYVIDFHWKLIEKFIRTMSCADVLSAFLTTFHAQTLPPKAFESIYSGLEAVFGIEDLSRECDSIIETAKTQRMVWLRDRTFSLMAISKTVEQFLATKEVAHLLSVYRVVGSNGVLKARLQHEKPSNHIGK